MPLSDAKRRERALAIAWIRQARPVQLRRDVVIRAVRSERDADMLIAYAGDRSATFEGVASNAPLRVSHERGRQIITRAAVRMYRRHTPSHAADCDGVCCCGST